MNKKGFMMWGDFFKGVIFGLVAGIVLMVLIFFGVVPFPYSFCG